MRYCLLLCSGLWLLGCTEPVVGPGQSGEDGGDDALTGGPSDQDDSIASDDGTGSESGDGSESGSGSETGSGTDAPPGAGEQYWLSRFATNLVAVDSDGDHILVLTAEFPGGSVLRLDAADGALVDAFALEHTPSDFAVLDDGQIAVTGTVESDAWLGWFDAEGQLLHAATFDGPEADWDTGDTLDARDGALFLLARETVDSESTLDAAIRTVRRFDGYEETWRVAVGEPGSHGVLSTAFAATSNGGFAAAGRKFPGNNESEVIVHRYDGDGALLGERAFPGSDGFEDFTPLALAAGPDDRLALSGHANWAYDFDKGFIGHDAALLLLDADGAPIREIAVPAERARAAAIDHDLGHAAYNDVVIDGSGDIIVVGETTDSVIHDDASQFDFELRQLVLTKYSGDGDELWTQSYDAELTPLGAPEPSPFLQNIIVPDPVGTYGAALALTATDELVVGGGQRMIANEPVAFAALHEN